MTIPFYCVLAAFSLILITKSIMAKAMAQTGKYDNNNPRDQAAQLTGWGRRAWAAHQNTIECFPVFAAFVFIGHLSGANPTWSAYLAIAFVVLRILYIGFYLRDMSNARSLVWISAVGCAVAIAVLGIFK